MNRRIFIKRAGLGMAVSSLGALPLGAIAAKDPYKLTILHTNDTHSRIEPFPMDGSRYAGMGGAEPRQRLIKKIRSEESNVLLVDAGDIFQGTPYFNLFDGALEISLMNEMGYEASVPGNHDFDKGIPNLVTQLTQAKFPMVITNYEIGRTDLPKVMKKHLTLQKGPIKVGIVGAGIHLDGLLTPSLYGDIDFLDPITTIEAEAKILRGDHKCDLVICLSHLGHKYENNKVSDIVLAAETSSVDIIIGGHTHTFLDAPAIVRNKVKRPVTVTQAGWGGIQLGRLDVYFEKNKKNKCVSCRNEWVL
jgi:5'-nucleotidase